ncbi:hypothetical protein MPLB_1200033 [Mesorhizobium sp. ORS 3324]|nr:hypothetical protein MPLB_1200033 [Mesorhizobium sp. ORS 3324]
MAAVDRRGRDRIARIRLIDILLVDDGALVVGGRGEDIVDTVEAHCLRAAPGGSAGDHEDGAATRQIASVSLQNTELHRTNPHRPGTNWS